MSKHVTENQKQARSQDAATAINVLKQRFGEQSSTSSAIREQHGHTMTWIENQPPDVVVFAQSTSDVCDVVDICRTYQFPVIPFGSGTSLEGHVNAPNGGVSLDLSRMDRIIAINEADLDCVVEPGVTRTSLNTYLRDRGFFFPVDPGAGHATLGGMASTRAAGTTTVRYGTMRENVLNLTAVMADGSVVRTARRARKSSAGYDLTKLLVGSEGTLGIITELTVRLYGIPESILAAVCPFKSIEGACNTVIQAIQLGLGLARIELLDALQIKACNAYSGLTLAEEPTLFLEFHGTNASTREAVKNFWQIAEDEGGLGYEWAESVEERNKLWQARHDVYWAGFGLKPGAQAVATDVCVPISRLAECVGDTQRDIAETGLIAPIAGHVGDGNFHVLPLVDMSDQGEIDRVSGFLDRLSQRALDMDGTCTGEHGIGVGKIKYLEAEHGAGVAVMRAIKHALDPDGIFNPGKILPDE